MKKAISIILTLAMTLALFAGCSSSTSSTEGTTSSATSSTTTTTDSTASSDTATTTDSSSDEEPDGVVAGSSINLYMASDFVTQQQPGQAPGAMAIYGMVYDTMFYSPSGLYDDITGLIAKDWTISDDGCVWVVNIHEDIYYVNGENMTAEKVVRAYQILSAEGQSSILDGAMTSYEATGEYQITFTYPQPNPEFMYQFANVQTGLFDPTLTDEMGVCTEAMYMASSGPYYIDEYATGDYMTFKANENYWNDVRMPHIETVNMKVILSQDTQVTALMSGEIDVGSVSNYSYYETLLSNNALTTQEWYGTSRAIWINASGWGCEYLANDRVREALCMMVDMEQVALAATGGYGESINNAVTDALDYVHNRTYDPDAGLAILAEEGVDPNDIVLYPITTNETSGIFSNMQAQLSQYGITMDYAIQDDPAVSTAMWAGEYDMVVQHGGASRYYFASALTMLLGEGGKHDVCRDEELDPVLWDLVSTAFSQPTYEEELDALVPILETLDTNYAYLGTVRLPNWTASAGNVNNVTLDQANGILMIWELWV